MNLQRAYNICACLLVALAITSYVCATAYTGEPALLRAAKIGNPDVVDALLDASAAVDAPDPGFQQTASSRFDGCATGPPGTPMELRSAPA